MGKTVWLSLAILAMLPYVFSIYVDTGNPYEPGKLSVSSFYLPSVFGGVPKRTLVYHPSEPGHYAVLFFISGLGGYIPSFIYENHLANISSHGYIVASSAFFVNRGGLEDNLQPLNGSMKEEAAQRYFDDGRAREEMLGDRADVYWKVLNWLEENLQDELAKRSVGVWASFDDLAYSCHSAGCGEVYELVMKNISRAKAITFLEPFVQIPVPGDFYLPGMFMGTEFGDYPPSCSQPGRDFRQNYENWGCPRVLSNVKNHGHCDILSPFGWQMCRLINFCTTEPDTDLNRYHMFLQGYTSAFYGTYVQNNGDMLKYVIDQAMIPIEFIEFKTDVSC